MACPAPCLTPPPRSVSRASSSVPVAVSVTPGGKRKRRVSCGSQRQGRGAELRGRVGLRLLPWDLCHLTLAPRGVGAASRSSRGTNKGRERPATCPRPELRAAPSPPPTPTPLHGRVCERASPGTWPRSVVPRAVGCCVPKFHPWKPEPAVRTSLEKGLQAVMRVTRSREGGPWSQRTGGLTGRGEMPGHLSVTPHVGAKGDVRTEHVPMSQEEALARNTPARPCQGCSPEP